ncbi:MAG: NUDIX domain-containing protein [Patescibacteria group bacterium]|nr:NUDIX domain-containing protein [Patescibacteria group bacterium]MBU2508776.1 NUDIX domain-containing protein [Patescibacteria group bacterium]
MDITGISQKAVILNPEGKFLIIHRTSDAPSNPNMWDLPGGGLDFGEDATTGIAREIKEETCLEVNNVCPFDVESHINRVGKFWVTICYKCDLCSDCVKLSCEHDDFKWVTEQEFFDLPASKKIRRFISNLKK